MLHPHHHQGDKTEISLNPTSYQSLSEDGLLLSLPGVEEMCPPAWLPGLERPVEVAQPDHKGPGIFGKEDQVFLMKMFLNYTLFAAVHGFDNVPGPGFLLRDHDEAAPDVQTQYLVRTNRYYSAGPENSNGQETDPQTLGETQFLSDSAVMSIDMNKVLGHRRADAPAHRKTLFGAQIISKQTLK